MDNTDIVKQIKHILNDRFGLEAAALNENSRLKDIGIDSLHVVEIMLDLEAALGVRLTDLSVPPNPSLGDVAAAIQKEVVTQS